MFNFFWNISTKQSGVPVKLYLDIEFSVDQNGGKIGSEMVKNLIEIINVMVLKTFDILSEVTDVFILDSCTCKKFSNHLIFQNVIFHDNKACSNFVKFVLENLLEKDIVNLTVVDSHGQQKLFVDTSVYSKNQNFRILNSSKFGKQTQLKLVQQQLNDNSCDTNFFMSLVSDKNFTVNSVFIEEKLCSNVHANISKPVLKNEKYSICSSNLNNIEQNVQSLIGKEGKIRKVSVFNNENTSKGRYDKKMSLLCPTFALVTDQEKLCLLIMKS